MENNVFRINYSSNNIYDISELDSIYKNVKQRGHLIRKDNEIETYVFDSIKLRGSAANVKMKESQLKNIEFVASYASTLKKISKMLKLPFKDSCVVSNFPSLIWSRWDEFMMKFLSID